MNEEQMVEALAQAARQEPEGRWYVEAVHAVEEYGPARRLRHAMDNGRPWQEECPIAFVARVRHGTWYGERYQAAGKRLGMPKDVRNRVAEAADHLDDHPLGQRLLHAVGLPVH